VDGLLWATGHYRNGILLAPLAANAIADLLSGQPPRPPFVAHSATNDERAAEEAG
jgi:glycine/D-amino acid oxidase-like deaminating enzyme